MGEAMKFLEYYDLANVVIIEKKDTFTYNEIIWHAFVSWVFHSPISVFQHTTNFNMEEVIKEYNRDILPKLEKEAKRRSDERTLQKQFSPITGTIYTKHIDASSPLSSLKEISKKFNHTASTDRTISSSTLQGNTNNVVYYTKHHELNQALNQKRVNYGKEFKSYEERLKEGETPKQDTSSINDTPERELAARILDKLNSMVMDKYNEPLFNNYSELREEVTIKEGLIGGLYYDCEDELTKLITFHKINEEGSKK